uniref:Arf-GAP with SH3 domain, ANK repeat and PH domain-containing protein 1 n=1 Tax=Ascaris suum TaxID=6253 RepID=F1KRU5_ASCSU
MIWWWLMVWWRLCGQHVLIDHRMCVTTNRRSVDGYGKDSVIESAEMASTSSGSGGGGGGGQLLTSFINSVKADLDSPVTSNFGTRIGEYRAQVQQIAEQFEGDVTEFERLRRISKDVEDAMNTLAKQLLAFAQIAKELAEKWTSRSDNENDSDAAIALLKMELFLRGEAELASGQLRNWHNNMVHPLDLLIAAPSDMRTKTVDKACRDYESKFLKAETEARKAAKQCGYTRSQLSHGELAEQLSRERLLVQYELCKFLLAMDAVEDKRGPQLLRHFMELFRHQDEYYAERLKMNDHFRRDLEKLYERISSRSATRCQQRNALFDLKTRLETSSEVVRTASNRRQSNRIESYNRGSRLSGVGIVGGTSSATIGLSPLTSNESESFNDYSPGQGSSSSPDFTFSGFLYKKSNKKLHKQWQKRRCRIFDGHFWLSHSDENVPPAKLDLLVSDCKPSLEDPKNFDLYCRDRTYHLQAESETDAKRWMMALKQEIGRVKAKMLSAETPQSADGEAVCSVERIERKLCVSALRRLPGNLECADCSSTEGVQWLSNVGALVCIACSGVHRELGVHVSRIQSLDLDVISSIEFLVPLSTGNAVINRIFEYEESLCAQWKPRAECSRIDRQRFIKLKYHDRCYIQKIQVADAVFCDATRELDVEKAYRALLSPYLTSLPFEAYGPFHQMIQHGKPMALPIAQLVVQLRIELPGLEAMLTECVNSGNADMLTILLHSHSLSSASIGVSLKPLEALAVKLGQQKVAHVLRSAQSAERSLFNQVTVPSCLIISTPDSGSLSRSSSSVSPLPRPSPDLASDPSTRVVSSSPPVNVLMRNGTTIAVSGGSTHLSSGGSFRANRSISPIEAYSSRRSSSYIAVGGAQAATSSFKGSTFGKCAPEETSFVSSLPRSIQLHPSASALDDVVEIGNTDPSSKLAAERLQQSVSSTDTFEKEHVQRTQVASTLETFVPAAGSLAIQQPVTPTAMPNYYTRVPGSLKLTSSKSVAVSDSRSGEDLRSPSSVPSSPVPALPLQPKPKIYHRSASEFNQPVPNVGALRDLHEQKVVSTSTASQRTSPASKSESTSVSAAASTTATAMSTSFTVVSTSISLDSIPPAEDTQKEEGTSAKEHESGDNKASKTVAEKREKMASSADGGHMTRAASGNGSTADDLPGSNKPMAFTSFESARASFMTPSERARFSMANVRSTTGTTATSIGEQLHKKTSSSDGGASTTKSTVPPSGIRLTRAAPPPPVGQAAKLKPPIPAPRRATGANEHPQKECIRRCRALYDCSADNPDELSFRQGDIIIVSKERIAGENDTWMEGYLASDPQRKGVFPITFVTFQS